VLPQVGKAAIPDIQLAERPAPPVFTDAEFNAMSITAKGKVLRSYTAWVSYANIADAAIQGYRSYLKSVFSEEEKQR